MKQIVVISGKGGTGKTTMVGSFAALAENKVIADCDVDAPDLHLILNPKILKTEEFRGSKVAIIDKKRCVGCGRCEEICRFDAIKDLEINPVRCEGCGACVFICPVQAISLKEKVSGYTYISETKYGLMAHARLNIAEEASGKLVTVVKENARKLAEENGKDLIIIDGSPGIGCPVIASIRGVDLALIVTEPTVSGIHDLDRILSVAKQFKVRSLVCINKFDINVENTERIEELCKVKGIEIIGKIPYDPVVIKAMITGKPVIELSKNEVADKIRIIWKRIMDCLHPT